MKPFVTLHSTKIIKVKIAYLKPHPEQPQELRLNQSIQKLMDAILWTGWVAPPCVLPIPGKKGYYYVVNGNRRVEACRRLGITELRVEVLPPEVDTTMMFAPAQSAERWGSKEYLSSWALAAKRGAEYARKYMMSIPSTKIANQIEEFVRLVGWNTAIRYGLTGKVSPNVVIRVYVICDELIARDKAKLARDPKFLKALTCWLLDTKSYKNVGDAYNFWSHDGYEHLFDEVLEAFEKRQKYVSVQRPKIHKSKNGLRMPTVSRQVVQTKKGTSLNRTRP
jgi:hypothetical protein